MQETLPFNGLTYATPNSTSKDGDTLILVNLRHKDNTLQPVTVGKAIGTLSQQYDFIYLHPTSNTQNYLGVIGNTLYSNIQSKPIKICTLDDTVQQIRHIANTLILFTSAGLFYLLFRNNTYAPLGYKPPLPEISISYSYNLGNLPFDSIEGTLPENLQTPVEALLTKCRWQENNAYKLSGMYLMRYALKLYDGSYILHSAPIFLYNNFELKHPYRISLAYIGSDFKPSISYANVTLYTIKTSIDTTTLNDWKDIVTSIDIFLSPELGMVSDNFKKIEDCTKTTSSADLQTHIHRVSFYPQDIATETIISNISDNGNFYLIKSIPINNATITTVKFPAKTEISTLQNLVYQPTLPVDNFSHHNITATYAYTYNQRLHLANIQTIFFEGFPFSHFCRVKAKATSNTSSTRPNTPDIIRPGTDSDGSGRSVTRPGKEEPEEQHIDNVYIEIYINTPDKKNAFVFTHTTNIDIYHLLPLFSYPDSRAYKAVIYYCDANNNITHKKELPLQQHSALNIAYYLDTSLLKITIPEATGYYRIPATTPLYIFDDQKIKVSALQNPFVFPNANTYLTSGKVIGMASNAQTLSEGQFGQFPLYIFTSEGVYAMSVGNGEIVYSNIIPVSEELALSNSITPVAGAVFFLTLRGAFLLIGSQTTSISDKLNANKPLQSMQFYDQIQKMLFPGLTVNNTSFLQFCQFEDLTVHFNYIQNELLIVSQQAGYAYVYNFQSHDWHTVTHIFAPVQNTYPRLLGVTDNKLIDVSDEIPSSTPVLLLSRPIKLRSQQYKTLHRFILRARLTNKADCGLFVYASNDAENFILISNLKVRAGSHRDLDTGLIPAATYRYYAVLFTANLLPHSRIDYLETTFYPTHDNDKLR